MRHDKIIKRPDGSKVNISIHFWMESFSTKKNYDVSISICEPKKRTFHYVNDTDNYTWRKLSHEEKNAYEHEINIKYATPEEIQLAKEELWQLLKPTL